MRLFIAIEFPEEVRDAIALDTEKLRNHFQSGRFVQRQNYHLTLAFLGETDPSRLTQIYDAMDCCGSPAFPISVGALGRFRRRDGDVLWRSINAPEELSILQNKLSDALKIRDFSLEDREFRPHLTLARSAKLRSNIHWGALSSQTRPALTFTAREITLFRSDRGASGQVYTPLRQKALIQ